MNWHETWNSLPQGNYKFRCFFFSGFRGLFLIYFEFWDFLQCRQKSQKAST